MPAEYLHSGGIKLLKGHGTWSSRLNSSDHWSIDHYHASELYLNSGFGHKLWVYN